VGTADAGSITCGDAIITADWKADSNERWTVPLGGLDLASAGTVDVSQMINPSSDRSLS
jgi:hypothetical protein